MMKDMANEHMKSFDCRILWPDAACDQVRLKCSLPTTGANWATMVKEKWVDFISSRTVETIDLAEHLYDDTLVSVQDPVKVLPLNFK